jgi:hypothetical protein
LEDSETVSILTHYINTVDETYSKKLLTDVESEENLKFRTKPTEKELNEFYYKSSIFKYIRDEYLSCTDP